MNEYLLLYFKFFLVVFRLLNLVNGIDLCARTSLTEIDRQPWWQVDLGRDYVIDGIDVVSNNDDFNHYNVNPNDHAYFIGASTEDDKEYKYICKGRSYYVLPSWPPRHQIVCQEPMLGRYVVIKKLSACKGEETCPLSQLPLSLCEVEVQGYHYDFIEEKAIDMALGSIAKQSGTVNDAGLAIDGILEYEPIAIKTPLCTIITKFSYVGPLWSLKLPSLHKIEKIIIYTNETNVDNLLVSIMAPFATACSPSKNENSEALTYNCNKELEAGGAFIMLRHSGSLVLCEVEVMAVNELENVNVALGKPANQSTVEYNAVAYLAVNGHRPRVFYKGSHRDPQCTHTKESGDKYPWWRVDLLQEFIVSEIRIYNRGETLHSRLHDIEIRVGNFDIIHYVDDDSIFRKNPLCFSNPDAFLNAGLNIISCNQRLIGRFVSIQIVELCKLEVCHWSAKERNMLTLCEVEVYGEGMEKDSLLEKNLAADILVQHSLDIDASLDLELIIDGHVDAHADNHPWLLVDLKTKSVVDRIIFVLNEEDRGHAPNFDIRVGNEEINQDYINHVFRKNVLCNRIANSVLKSGENEFRCHHPLVGRYVSLQITENCTNIFCATNYERLVSLDYIDVWGYFYHEINPLKNVAYKATTKGADIVTGNSSLTVDGIFPSQIFETEIIEQCSQTDGSHIYPWFQLELKNLSLVDSVSIILPGNGDNYKLHDFQIRVGFNDLSLVDIDEPFSENALCFESYDRNYTEGLHKFSCTLPLIGNFVTIQIIEKRYDPIIHENEKNVLMLCEVIVSGYPPPADVQIQNLSIKKPAIQSSTNDDEIANLAVNGVPELGNDTVTYFESCSKDVPQCTVDTSQLWDCAQVYKKGCLQSGIYILSYKKEGAERIYFSAYCDMKTAGGGWTVFQRRDTSLSRQVKFENSWLAYKEGFGTFCGEFWLGNEFIHNFGAGYELRIDLIIKQEKSVIKCNTFSIDDEANNYTAHIHYCDGDVDVRPESINNKPFETYDRTSKTEYMDGGWWFSDEKNEPFNLNGEEAMIILFPPNRLLTVDKTEMKIRPIGFNT